MNWSTATLHDVEKRCRERLRLGTGITVSPKWLLALIHDYRLLSGDRTCERCEHGAPDGDWCEPCNRAYKEAAKAVENQCD